jgi:hypothetical protein
MDEVGARRVPPVLRTLIERVWVGLVAEVVEPVQIPDSVDVVKPAHRGGEVHLTAVRLVVVGEHVWVVRTGAPERTGVVHGIGPPAVPHAASTRASAAPRVASDRPAACAGAAARSCVATARADVVTRIDATSPAFAPAVVRRTAGADGTRDHGRRRRVRGTTGEGCQKAEEHKL